VLEELVGWGGFDVLCSCWSWGVIRGLGFGGGC
jgi:hypothetical protein